MIIVFPKQKMKRDGSDCQTRVLVMKGDTTFMKSSSDRLGGEQELVFKYQGLYMLKNFCGQE